MQRTISKKNILKIEACLQTVSSEQNRGVCSARSESWNGWNLFHHVSLSLAYRQIIKWSTSCCRHSSDKFLRLGLLIMNYESFLCVQSEFMLKTIPAGYSLLVIFQIYFFTTIKNDQKTINFIYFCSNSQIFEIICSFDLNTWMLF